MKANLSAVLFLVIFGTLFSCQNPEPEKTIPDSKSTTTTTTTVVQAKTDVAVPDFNFTDAQQRTLFNSNTVKQIKFQYTVSGSTISLTASGYSADGNTRLSGPVNLTAASSNSSVANNLTFTDQSMTRGQFKKLFSDAGLGNDVPIQNYTSVLLKTEANLSLPTSVDLSSAIGTQNVTSNPSPPFRACTTCDN